MCSARNTSQNQAKPLAPPITHIINPSDQDKLTLDLGIRFMQASFSKPHARQEPLQSPVSTLPYSTPLQSATSMSNVEPSRCGLGGITLSSCTSGGSFYISFYFLPSTSFLNVPQLSFSSAFLHASGSSFNSPSVITIRTPVTDAAGYGLIAKYH